LRLVVPIGGVRGEVRIGWNASKVSTTTASLSVEPIPRPVGRDPSEPGAELRLTPEAVQIRERADEDLLEKVVGLVGTAGQAKQLAGEVVPVVLEDQTLRAGIARTGGFHRRCRVSTQRGLSLRLSSSRANQPAPAGWSGWTKRIPKLAER
jgi:hypothetical protein